MKIAFIYDAVYPYRHGGGEKRNWELARRLVKRGHDVTLVCLRMWDGPPEIVKDGVKLAGVCPCEPSFFRSGRRSTQEPRIFAEAVGRYLAANRFDILDCASFPYLPCFKAHKAACSGAGRLVITWYEIRGYLRWMDHRGLLGLAAGWLERRVASLHATHVAISDFTREQAVRVLDLQDVQVVPCGVAPGEFTGIELPRRNQILYVGRLAAYKRVDMLLRAFAAVAPSVPDATLKIVGEGEARTALLDLAVELGINLRVEFAARLDEADLRKEFCASRVFVLPSEQEGFGIVVAEAMAAGTPPVVLDSPGSAAVELVLNRRNGMLVHNATGMADAIKLLLTDHALWSSVSNSGRATAARYDWDSVVVPALEALYRR